jgi:hypothetical protein
MKQRYGLVLLPYPLFMGLANENPTTLTSNDLAGFVDISEKVICPGFFWDNR